MIRIVAYNLFVISRCLGILLKVGIGQRPSQESIGYQVTLAIGLYQPTETIDSYLVVSFFKMKLCFLKNSVIPVGRFRKAVHDSFQATDGCLRFALYSFNDPLLIISVIRIRAIVANSLLVSVDCLIVVFGNVIGVSQAYECILVVEFIRRAAS